MPIFAALLPVIAQLIPQIAQIFKPGSPVAQRNVAAAELLANTLVESTQSVNLQEAVDKMQTSPEAKAAATVAVQERWFELSELVEAADKIHSFETSSWGASERSMDAAAARGTAMQEAGPLYRNPQFIVATYVMVLVAIVVVLVMLKDVMFVGAPGFSTDMQAFVIGAIVGSALTAVLAYFFGTSRSSAAKDVVISEMSRRA